MIKPAGTENRLGPFSKQRIQEMAREGLLSPGDRISRDGKHWSDAGPLIERARQEAGVPAHDEAPAPDTAAPASVGGRFVGLIDRTPPRVLQAVVLGFLVLVVFLGYQWWTRVPDYSHRYGPGVTAPDAPRQVRAKDDDVFEHKGFTIEPLYDFQMTARVLSVKGYSGGSEGILSPRDLGLGWGRMSDPEVLSRITFSQRDRFCYWRARELPIPKQEINHCMTNTHIIPASDEIDEVLRSIERGQLVRIEGMLINATRGGWYWKSSTTRADTGDGACEVIYTTRLEVLQ